MDQKTSCMEQLVIKTSIFGSDLGFYNCSTNASYRFALRGSFELVLSVRYVFMTVHSQHYFALHWVVIPTVTAFQACSVGVMIYRSELDLKWIPTRLMPTKSVPESANQRQYLTLEKTSKQMSMMLTSLSLILICSLSPAKNINWSNTGRPA